MAKKKMAVVIPLTPSFLKVGEQYVSIGEFTEDELREIGKEWTENLIKKANKIAEYKKEK